MKQIQLTTTEKGNSIHVDDVDVSKGVYYKWYNGKGYVHVNGGLYYARAVEARPDFEQTKHFTSLAELIEDWVYAYNCQFFTLSGQLITLEKELTIDQLKDSDHVGFVTRDGEKGFIQYLGGGIYVAASIYNTIYWERRNSVEGLIESSKGFREGCQPEKFYLFETRAGGEDSLFAWLNK